MDLGERWLKLLEDLRAEGRYRRPALPAGIDFSSNDYLGFGAESAPGLPWPRGGLGSRLLRGHHALWEQVETALAAWHRAEAALLFTSGYTANEGLLSTVIQPEDFLASDQGNHASLIDGGRLSKAERFIFRHNDLDHLENGLADVARKRSAGRELFVVTESMFGMEGEQAQLAGLVEICQRYQAHLIGDEAHATGCFGPRGSGLVDDGGFRDRILASVHTGGKALGVTGAYVCGSAQLRELLINRCRHFIFTTALPPAIAAWWLEAIRRVQAADQRRQNLHQASRLFRMELNRAGISPPGEHFIIPLILGADHRAMAAAERLQAAGWDIRAIRPPTVPVGTARLRISIHAGHDAATLPAAAPAVAYTVAPACAGGS